MKKKNIFIVLILLMIMLFSGCSSEDKTYTHKNVNSISKENVINILKAEYGDNISTTINEIKPAGDYYIVEVYIDIKDSEEAEESHSKLGEHTHRESLGIHKINMYTGELSKAE